MTALTITIFHEFPPNTTVNFKKIENKIPLLKTIHTSISHTKPTKTQRHVIFADRIIAYIRAYETRIIEVLGHTNCAHCIVFDVNDIIRASSAHVSLCASQRCVCNAGN